MSAAADGLDPEVLLREAGGGKTPRFYDGGELDEIEFPPIAWVLPGIIPEGVTILAGRPKIGKSWMVLDLAVQIANGGAYWGKSITQRPVLYLALEDNKRRMKQRAAKLGTSLRGVSMSHDWPAGLDGVTAVNEWLGGHSGGVVVVDTFGKMAPPTGKPEDSARDDRIIRELHRMARDRGASVIVVTHLVKSTLSADWMDEVRGQMSWIAQADTVLALKRERGQSTGYLHFDGRDIEDNTDLALSFDDASWSLLGEAGPDIDMTNRQREVHEMILHSKGMTAEEIAKALQVGVRIARKHIKALRDRGVIRKEGEFYVRPDP